MGFATPDQAVMEQHRDAAVQAHKSYWQAQGVATGEEYFPGFEAGWNAACEALLNGGSLPQAGEQGKGEDQWEWTHGFKKGTEDAEQAGQVADEQPQEEHHEEEQAADE